MLLKFSNILALLVAARHLELSDIGELDGQFVLAGARRLHLLAAGDVDKAFKVSVNFISTAAKEKIESAGGNIVE